MREIKLLDCTLRDGGYVNDWEFGNSAMTCIFDRLACAGIDIIEIGFLDDRRTADLNRTIQPDTKSLDAAFANVDKQKSMVLAMIDYGTCSLEHIAPCEESFLDGIRVIFKKPNMKKAVEYAQALQEKGYTVCLQLVSITSYNDRDILDLTDLINGIRPYAVSIVDTYGLMHKEEMLHYYDLLDHNLLAEIVIGYHSHNNFQLAYTNAIELLNKNSSRSLLIDGTVYGMGKGAGNAPLELLAMHLNEKYGKQYDLDQILEAIDTNIMKIYQEQYWGYSLLYYLAASNDCHPNYISYLLKKKTLSIKAINDIVKHIEVDLKLNYSQAHIEQLYTEYQKQFAYENGGAFSELKVKLSNRKILLLGPGHSLLTEAQKIKAYINQHHPLVISVNCIPKDFTIDYAFISNAKRYSMLVAAFKNCGNSIKVIATSNVTSVGKPFDFVLSYEYLLDENRVIEDNAFIMLLKFLREISPELVMLAGFDGFSPNLLENYYDEYMELSADVSHLLLVNEAVSKKLLEFQQQINIQFLTKSLYQNKVLA